MSSYYRLTRQKSMFYFKFFVAFILIVASDADCAQLTLKWNQSPSPGVDGYILYYGTKSRDYTESVDVGNTTSCVISNLEEGQTYFFAATAYYNNTTFLEGVPSEELSVEVPPTIVPPADSDGDGIIDDDEIDIYGTNPNKSDSDGDGINDGTELAFWGDDWDWDFDGDGLVNLHDPDSDNDGFSDGNEFDDGYDLMDPNSKPQPVIDPIGMKLEDFERTDSATVGNGWVEVESSVSSTRVSGGKLVFDAADDSFRPLVYHSFALQDKGVMTWSFDLNFERTGTENTYSFWMQLGQRSLMSDADPRDVGVAVNLKWGGPTAGLNTHEGLAYVLNGQVHQFATVSGIETVTVVVDLDQQLYSVAVGNQEVLEIPFDNSVSIDTVRFFAHQLNRSNFAFRELDNVVLALEQSEPVNTSPTAFNQNVSSFATLPVSIKLSFSDPDGPGPYSYSIISDPANGSLSGIASDFIYTADRGFTGLDSFTWSITDGLDESNVATVSITVELNMPPVANDFTASTLVGMPVNVSLSDNALDTDGPDPIQCNVLAGPDNGELVGIASSEWTYTPEPGFTGQEAFTWRCNDGLDDSNVATATIVVSSGPDTNNILLTEDFEKTDSATVGNGWVEVESSVSSTRVSGGKLVFDAVDDSFRPLVYHSFALQDKGVMTWSFDLNFERTGTENTYSFWMQLGQRSLMSDADPRDVGVAVNLKWGGPTAGLNTHEGLAYVLNGQVHQFATVSGIETVTVVVDLDQQLYSVAVGNQEVLEIPFDNSVSIDTVRFFAHQLNRSNFAFRELDNVTLQWTGAW